MKKYFLLLMVFIFVTGCNNVIENVEENKIEINEKNKQEEILIEINEKNQYGDICVIPQINLSGSEIKSLNNDIKNKVLESDPTTYFYYQNDNILSLVLVEQGPGDESYYAYNIDIEGKRLFSNSELLNRKNVEFDDVIDIAMNDVLLITTDEYKELKKRIQKYDSLSNRELDELNDDEITEYTGLRLSITSYENTLSVQYELSTTQMFLDDDGTLCIEVFQGGDGTAGGDLYSKLVDTNL